MVLAVMRCQLKLFSAALLSMVFYSCTAQEPASNVLMFDKAIMLSVRGRIDHMDVNLKNQVVYVAALGNNSIEVVDLRGGKLIHSIKDLDEPQGVAYIPQTDEILVANGGNGDCYFYNARNFEKTGVIHLKSDADDVRYDSVQKKIYVGYGTGGIAIIDALARTLSGDIQLPAHPESFQFDRKLNLLFVNLPDANKVGIVDLKKMKLTGECKGNQPAANFPMAVDTMRHRIFVGYRHPARLLVFDAASGNEIGAADMTGDADDQYYSYQTQSIYISGGSGSISIFHSPKEGSLIQTASIQTRKGARTSLLVPELNLFMVAARADSDQPAELLIYHLGKNK
jgi:hypothetical protein